MTTKEINLDDLQEVVMDMQGIEELLIHLESSEYFKGSEEDSLVFRAVRNSIECARKKIKGLMED